MGKNVVGELENEMVGKGNEKRRFKDYESKKEARNET